MNYREYMRECIKSPIDGTSAVEFGKWAILNQEQRKMIGRLLDEMDRFDEAYKTLWMKYEDAKKKIDELEEYKWKYEELCD
jgi:archaellum component FlaC